MCLERPRIGGRSKHCQWLFALWLIAVRPGGPSPRPPSPRLSARPLIRTAEEFTPPSWQLIFTAYLDGVTDTGWVPRLERLASARGAIVVPVRLLCDPEEIARRIVSSERRKRMKSADPEEPHRLATAGPPYDPGHPNTLTLDITAMVPDEAAARILVHAESVGRASGQWPTASG